MTCDDVDCTQCALMGEFIAEHSAGHAWVCYDCARTHARSVGHWADGFCDLCGGTVKGRGLGSASPEQDCILQLVELRPGLLSELQRRQALIDEHYIPPDTEVR